MARGNFYVSLKQPYGTQEKFSSFTNNFQNPVAQDPIPSSDPISSNAQSQLQQDSNVYYSIVGTSAAIIALALYQLIISAIYANNRRKEQNNG